MNVESKIPGNAKSRARRRERRRRHVKEAEARLKILIWCKRMEKLLEKNENTYASERWRLIQNAGNHLEQPSGNAAPDGDHLRDHDGAGHRAVD